MNYTKHFLYYFLLYPQNFRWCTVNNFYRTIIAPKIKVETANCFLLTSYCVVFSCEVHWRKMIDSQADSGVLLQLAVMDSKSL